MREGGLITVARLKQLDAMDALAGYDDAALEVGILEVSVWLEGLVGHDWGYAADTAYTVIGRGSSYLDLAGQTPYPLAGLPSNIQDPHGWSLLNNNAIHLVPFGPVADGVAKTIQRLDGRMWPEKTNITITGNWGWVTVPSSVELAAFRLVRRYFTDESFRELMSGTGSDSGGLRSLSVSNTTVSVGFGTNQSSLNLSGTGDPVATAIIRKYIWRVIARSVV